MDPGGSRSGRPRARRGIGAATVVAIVVTVAAAPAGFMAEAPPPGFTGGFGEATCVACHLGNDVNAFGGQVRIEGAPKAYEPGAEYVMTVVLSAEDTEVAGFQLAARFTRGDARGHDAGRLHPVDGRTAVTDSVGISYLHQTPAGSATLDRSGSSWSVGWTAPESGAPVAIHVAANSGNGDNSPLSDLVYTTERVIPPAR